MTTGTNSEIDKNMERDVARYGDGADSTVSNRINITEYVTLGIVSWLDGYYYSNDRTNSNEIMTVQFTSSSLVIDQNSAYIFASGINYVESKYYWSNDYVKLNDTWTNSLQNEGAVNAKVNLSLPKDENGKPIEGKYYLWLKVVDDAGNIVVYRFDKEFVVDTDAPKLVQSTVINQTSCANNGGTYYCNNGDIIEMVVSFDKDIMGTEVNGTEQEPNKNPQITDPTFKFGSKDKISSYTAYRTGMNIYFVYTIAQNEDPRDGSGDNGDLTFTLYNDNKIIDALGNVATSDSIAKNTNRITGLTSNYNLAVVADTLYPYITNMVVSEHSKTIEVDGVTYYTYKEGDTIEITFTFSENVRTKGLAIELQGISLNDGNTIVDFKQFACTDITSLNKTTKCSYTVVSGNDAYNIRVVEVSGDISDITSE